MTGQQWLYLAIVVAVAMVILIALWKGNPFSFNLNKDSVSFEGREKAGRAEATKVAVGKGVKLTDVETGPITGAKGAAAQEMPDSIDVLGNAQVRGGKLGAITGWDGSGNKDAVSKE